MFYNIYDYAVLVQIANIFGEKSMVTEKYTEKYKIYPQKLIESSFSTAYDSNNSAPVVYKPDTVVTVTGCISLALAVGMCVLTWATNEKKPFIWLVIGALFLFFIFLVLKNHFKKLKEYNKVNSKGADKFDHKSEYTSLFPSDLPASMNAYDFLLEIAKMQGKQKNDVYNNALRNLVTKLNKVNNPDEILCKNLTLYGNVCSQQRHRFYLSQDGGDIILFDSNFQSPSGELVFTADDVVAFGDPGSFDLSKIMKNNVKLSSDSLIIAVKTGEGEDEILYLEAHAKDADKIKKIVGSKKKI